MDGSVEASAATFCRGPIATDITALCPISVGCSSILLAGCGGNVLVYRMDQQQINSSSSLLLAQPALKGLRVHGIAAHRLPSPDQCLVVVHGAARVQLWVLTLAAPITSVQQTEASQAVNHNDVALTTSMLGQPALRPLCSMHCLLDLGHQEAWVMHSLLQPWHCDPICTQQPTSAATQASAVPQPGAQSALSLALSLGLINNRVQVWQLDLVRVTSSSSTNSQGASGGHSGAATSSLWPGWRVQAQLRQVTECSERCLLYSMHLNTGAANPGAPVTWVAAGTISGDVLIWATDPLPVHQQLSNAQLSSGTSGQQTPPGSNTTTLSTSSITRPQEVKEQQQQPPLLTVAPLAVLKGHRSSIFSVRWVGPGDISHLVSASDDRTARVWQVHLQEQHHQQGIQGLNSQGQGEDMQVQGGGAAQPAAILSTSCVAVLTGHTARVWDASLLRLPDNSLVAATGGEDCALRLWVLPSRTAAGAPQLLDGGASNHSGGPDSVNSQQSVSPACAAMLQGHRGRGVWRLALVNSSGGAGPMLISGGADASIKLWWLPAWLPLTSGAQLGANISTMGTGGGSGGTQEEAQAGGATTSKLPTSLLATQAPALQRLQLRCKLPGVLGAPAIPQAASVPDTAITEDASAAAKASSAPMSSGTAGSKGKGAGQLEEKVKMLQFGSALPHSAAAPNDSCTTAAAHHMPALPLYIGTSAGAIIAVKLCMVISESSKDGMASAGQGIGDKLSLDAQHSHDQDRKAGQGVEDSWELIHSDPSHGAVQCLAPSPCGNFLLAGTSRGAAVLLDLLQPAHSDNSTSAASGSCDADSRSKLNPPTIWQAHQQGILHVKWLLQSSSTTSAINRGLMMTCDASTRIRMWQHPHATPSPHASQPQLLAECCSPFGQPLLCFAYSATAGLLVTGDYKGNIMGWTLPCDLIHSGAQNDPTPRVGDLNASSSKGGAVKHCSQHGQQEGTVATEAATTDMSPQRDIGQGCIQDTGPLQPNNNPAIPSQAARTQLPLVLLHKGAHGKSPVRLIWLDHAAGRMVTGGGDHALSDWVLPWAAALQKAGSAPAGASNAVIRVDPSDAAPTMPACTTVQASGTGGGDATSALAFPQAGVRHLTGLTVPTACCDSSSSSSSSSSSNSNSLYPTTEGVALPTTSAAVPADGLSIAVRDAAVAGQGVGHSPLCNSGVGQQGHHGLVLVAGFHGNQFRVMDLEADAEVLREEVGGVHRPTAFLAHSRDSLALAWYDQQSQALHVTLRGNILQQYTPVQSHVLPQAEAAVWNAANSSAETLPSPDGQRSSAATAAAPATPASVFQPLPPCQNLHLTHHGMETLCMAMLPVSSASKPSVASNTSPSAAAPAPAAQTAPTAGLDCISVLTGSEDSTLRQVVAMRVPGKEDNSSSHWSPVFQQSSEVGEHAGGNAVRCLSVYPLPAHTSNSSSLLSSNHSLPSQQAGSYLMVSGGAKESVNAWVLQAVPPHTQQPSPDKSTAAQQLPGAHPGLSAATPSTSGFTSRLLSSLPTSVLSTSTHHGGKEAVGKQLRMTADACGHQLQGTHAQGHKRCLAVAVLGRVADHTHDRAATCLPGASTDGANVPSTQPPHHAELRTESHSSYLVTLSISDATLRLLSVDTLTGRWSHVTHLVHHTHPVLSLAAAPLDMQVMDSKQQGADASTSTATDCVGRVSGSILASGATDGSVALWHLFSHSDGSSNSVATTSSNASPAPTWPQAVRPALTLPGVHAAGVNSLTLAWAGEVTHTKSEQGGGVTLSRLLALMTGGDDQALAVTLIRVTQHMMSHPVEVGQMAAAGARVPAGPIGAAVLSRFTLPNAHSSSVRSVKHLELPTGPARKQLVVVSAGLDQRVRAWRLEVVSEPEGHQSSATTPSTTPPLPTADAGAQQLRSIGCPAGLASEGGQEMRATLVPLGSAVAEVPELCAVDAVWLGGVEAGECARAAVAVAGRGVQVLELSLA